MKHGALLFFVSVCLVFSVLGYAEGITVDLRNVPLSDALRILAKFTNKSVVITAKASKNITLHLNNVSPQAALNSVLFSQNLTQTMQGDIIYVQSTAEWMRQKEIFIKMQDLQMAASNLESAVWQVRYAKAEDIARLIEETNNSLLSKRGHLRADLRTNRLFIQDVPEKLAEIKKLIQNLDLPVRQVLIEARLVSVDNDFERELGVHFGVSDAMAETFNPAGQSGRGQLSVAMLNLADGSKLDIALAAMENQGHGQLISSPSLFTGNQQPASIESGEEIPYQEISRSGATGVVFKKAVLSLKVTPQVMPDNQVLLQLQINQDRPSSRIVLGVPAITTRQMMTNVLVKTGQTLVLGGIYEINSERDEQYLPFLGKIPIAGWAFKQQNKKENKRELLIFVTPKIIA